MKNKHACTTRRACCIQTQSCMREKVSVKLGEGKMKTSDFLAAGSKAQIHLKQLCIILTHTHSHTRLTQQHGDTNPPEYLLKDAQPPPPQQTGEHAHLSYVFRSIQFCSCQTSL